MGIKEILEGAGGMDDESDDDDALEVKAPKEEKSDVAEVSAMRLFEKATTPEKKARAMRLFLKACGAI
jgi:hypothetical protein